MWKSEARTFRMLMESPQPQVIVADVFQRDALVAQGICVHSFPVATGVRYDGFWAIGPWSTLPPAQLLQQLRGLHHVLRLAAVGFIAVPIGGRSGAWDPPDFAKLLSDANFIVWLPRIDSCPGFVGWFVVVNNT